MIANLVNSLKEVITQQTSIIESARTEKQEVKTEQKALREQNTKLQEEIQALRTQFETQATTKLSPGSWAAVATTNSPQDSIGIIPQSKES
jgi:peptidoglycan hydrolase CwlO-like protein